MWRAFFVAVGIALCIVGGECLVIDKAVIAKSPEGTPAPFTDPKSGLPTHDVKPPEWAPWSMISAGAVVLLYSFTIPRRPAS